MRRRADLERGGSPVGKVCVERRRVDGCRRAEVLFAVAREPWQRYTPNAVRLRAQCERCCFVYLRNASTPAFYAGGATLV